VKTANQKCAVGQVHRGETEQRKEEASKNDEKDDIGINIPSPMERKKPTKHFGGA